MTKEIECRSTGIDCPFMVRSESDNELATFAQQHVKNMHQRNMSREDILKSAREV